MGEKRECVRMGKKKECVRGEEAFHNLLESFCPVQNPANQQETDYRRHFHGNSQIRYHPLLPLHRKITILSSHAQRAEVG